MEQKPQPEQESLQTRAPLEEKGQDPLAQQQSKISQLEQEIFRLKIRGFDCTQIVESHEQEIKEINKRISQLALELTSLKSGNLAG